MTKYEVDHKDIEEELGQIVKDFENSIRPNGIL